MSTAASFTTFSDPEPEAPCIAFGKHRGQPLTGIESSYLEWVKTADRVTPDLLAAIERELASRAPKSPDRWRAPTGTSKDTIEFARLIIEAGHQELVAALTDYHIDAAAELLKFCLADVELHSDPGTLPPF